MTTPNIFAVVDENGVVINRILINPFFQNTYWPGYGHGLIDLGPAPVESLPPPEPPPPPSPVVIDDVPIEPPPNKDPTWEVIQVDVIADVSIGDTIDLVTGDVTEVVAIEELPIEELPVEP